VGEISRIRPFQENDRDRVVELWNGAYPFDSISADQLAHDDAAVKLPRRADRFVAEIGGTVVGVADFEQPLGTFDPETFWVRVFVHPESQGAGIGGALYDSVTTHLRQFMPRQIRSFWNEDHEVAGGFAARRGFVETKRDWEMVLDLPSFEGGRHQEFIERVEDHGLRIRSMAEWMAEGDIGQAFHEFFRDVRQDVPRSEPVSDLSFEEFSDFVLDAPDLIREGTFFVFDGDVPVAMTMSWHAGDPPELHTGLTATTRSHRGRGLATALKVSALSWGQADGRVRAVTDNDINNVEMLAVNTKLGYVKQPALISGLKELRPRPEPADANSPLLPPG
jgi:GNAT superfamily N-acetyltransferase